MRAVPEITPNSPFPGECCCKAPSMSQPFVFKNLSLDRNLLLPLLLRNSRNLALLLHKAT